jgi:hypothetical protein
MKVIMAACFDGIFLFKDYTYDANVCVHRPKVQPVSVSATTRPTPSADVVDVVLTTSKRVCALLVDTHLLRCASVR